MKYKTPEELIEEGRKEQEEKERKENKILAKKEKQRQQKYNDRYRAIKKTLQEEFLEKKFLDYVSEYWRRGGGKGEKMEIYGSTVTLPAEWAEHPWETDTFILNVYLGRDNDGSIGFCIGGTRESLMHDGTTDRSKGAEKICSLENLADRLTRETDAKDNYVNVIPELKKGKKRIVSTIENYYKHNYKNTSKKQS